MRGVAALIFYMLGLGAVVSFGIAGLMALQSPTSRLVIERKLKRRVPVTR